ncbi:unnamed protein product [Ixodes pacificus]
MTFRVLEDTDYVASAYTYFLSTEVGHFGENWTAQGLAEKLCESGCPVVSKRSYELLSLASKMKAVTLLLLPVEVQDYAVAQVLGAYRKVICMTQETHREYPTLETGTRRVIMEMEKEGRRELILAGDLNCVLDKSKDVLGGTQKHQPWKNTGVHQRVWARGRLDTSTR